MNEVKQIPTLRFGEFSDEWKIESIGNYIDLFSGYAFKGDDISEDETGVPILRGINITEGHIRHNVKIDRYFIGDTSKFEKLLLEVNDLVLGMDGSKVGKNVALITEKDKGALLIQRVARIRANNQSDIRYIYQHIFSNKFHRYVDVVNTSSGIPHISSKQIKDFKIGFPQLQEQQKIATFLTVVDKKITQLQQKKTLLEQYKKGLMQQLFSQDLRFKDANGNEYPDWEEKELGQIGNVINGLTYSPKDIDNEGVLVLRSSNVQNRILTFDDNVYVNVKEGNYNPVKEKDILICVRNGSKRLIGKNAIINKQNEGVAFGAFMAIYRSYYNSFLFHLFDTDYYNKQVYVNLGATINSINGSDLKKFKMPLPSKEEQTKIANFLSTIDTKIELVKTQLENTQQFKKGLLQQMFV